MEPGFTIPGLLWASLLVATATDGTCPKGEGAPVGGRLSRLSRIRGFHYGQRCAPKWTWFCPRCAPQLFSTRASIERLATDGEFSARRHALTAISHLLVACGVRALLRRPLDLWLTPMDLLVVAPRLAAVERECGPGRSKEGVGQIDSTT